MKIKAGYINNMKAYLLSVLIFIGIFAVFAAIIPIIVNRFTNDTSSGEIDIFFATAIYGSIAFAISNLLSFNSYMINYTLIIFIGNNFFSGEFSNTFTMICLLLNIALIYTYSKLYEYKQVGKWLNGGS